MSVRNNPPNGELETMIRQTLAAQVDGVQPRATVWWRIKTIIVARQPNRIPLWRWSLMAQILVALLVFSGGRMIFSASGYQLEPMPPTVPPNGCFTCNFRPAARPAAH